MEYRRTYRGGLSRFDEQRDPVDHLLDPVLPAEPGPVHAVQVTRVDREVREPEFLTSPLAYKTALCGAVVKVELPMEFDPGDEDSCPRCVGPALRNERTPARGWDDVPPENPGDEDADAALLRARAAADTGRRTDLDAVITALGYERAELEAELDAEELTDRFRRLPPVDPQRLREDIDATVDQRLPGAAPEEDDR